MSTGQHASLHLLQLTWLAAVNCNHVCDASKLCSMSGASGAHKPVAKLCWLPSVSVLSLALLAMASHSRLCICALRLVHALCFCGKPPGVASSPHVENGWMGALAISLRARFGHQGGSLLHSVDGHDLAALP